jgi:hypothetical protein
MRKIHDYLFKMKDYISHTIDSMQNYLDKTNHLVKYEDFNNDLQIHKTELTHLLKELEFVTPFTISIHKIFEIGHIMHLFYQLYNNKEYSDSLLYSFGFNGYMDLLSGLKTNIDSFKLNKTTFLSKEEKKDKSKKKNKPVKKPTFKKMYYPKFIDNTEIITNDCKFNKNLIITGPNASGKTTVLKGAMINLILSKQIGYGCY